MMSYATQNKVTRRVLNFSAQIISVADGQRTTRKITFIYNVISSTRKQTPVKKGFRPQLGFPFWRWAPKKRLAGCRSFSFFCAVSTVREPEIGTNFVPNLAPRGLTFAYNARDNRRTCFMTTCFGRVNCRTKT
jgi:hypothetical protein